MQHIRTIAFDLDGVLTNTKEIHKEALDRALMAFGCEAISTEDHVKKYNGLPTRIKLAMLIAEGKIPKSVSSQEIEKLKQFYTEQMLLQDLKPDKKLRKTIAELKKKYVIICVTNSIRKMTHIMLQQVGILDLFDFIVTNEDVDKNKPYPEPYLKACDISGTVPHRMLVIEDSAHGIQSAKSARCHVCPVTSPKDVSLKNINKFICQLAE